MLNIFFSIFLTACVFCTLFICWLEYKEYKKSIKIIKLEFKKEMEVLSKNLSKKESTVPKGFVFDYLDKFEQKLFIPTYGMNKNTTTLSRKDWEELKKIIRKHAYSCEEYNEAIKTEYNYSSLLEEE